MTLADDQVLTPTVRRVVRRSLFWAGATTVALLVSVAFLALSGAGAQEPYLSPENPAPDGAMAVAEVLRERGVEVVFTETFDDTRTAIEDPATTTILLYDTGLLDTSIRPELLQLAERLVVVDPGPGELDDFAPQVMEASLPDTGADAVVEADCPVPAVQRAQRVSGLTSGYRIGTSASGAVGCLETDPGVYSLVAVHTGNTSVTVLGAGDALTNSAVAFHGNAALALNLLGKNPTLVWYLPGIADVGAPPTLGELTPVWLTPAMLLLALVAVAAGVWRGRRMGPLVIENLPVVVPASETMEGRARLYEKSSARSRSLDALRIGTIGRLAAACALPRSATVDEVAGAVASLVGADLHSVRALLIEVVPHTDRDLVRYSDQLLELEFRVAEALGTGPEPANKTPGE